MPRGRKGCRANRDRKANLVGGVSLVPLAFRDRRDCLVTLARRGHRDHKARSVQWDHQGNQGNQGNQDSQGHKDRRGWPESVELSLSSIRTR